MRLSGVVTIASDGDIFGRERMELTKMIVQYVCVLQPYLFTSESFDESLHTYISGPILEAHYYMQTTN